MGQRLWMVLAVALVASVAWGRQGVVQTRQGQTVEGEITEKPDSVVVNVRGIEMEIQRGEITSLTYPDSLDAQYRQRLEKLEAADVPGRLALARWAFENRRYDLARDAAERALAIDANSREAVDFLQLVRKQQELDQLSGQGRTGGTGAGQGDAGPATGARPPAAPRTLLDDEQINKIKQAELREGDANIRVRFANNVQRRFVSAYNKSASVFLAQRPVDQALAILDEADPKFHDDVIILNDPAPLLEFRNFIQPMVLQNCATSQCHAPGNSTGFTLYSERSDAATYTNFYIMQQYGKRLEAPGSPFGSGPAVRKMIDRNQPQMSLLAQYGLPTDIAEVDHPQATGWRPMFRDIRDPRYQQSIDWMRSLRPIEPEYGIDYPLPGKPTSQPATQPR